MSHVRPDTDKTLAKLIEASRTTGDPVETVLETSAQVIARVTDGIYRHPASAFRELISNAYDADATKVVIQTDRPRFKRITITDDGNGMGPDAVAHLIRNIGGSAKRSTGGAGLNVTSADDPFCSPGGRRLIGKIGIGLFSVSQLTHSFEIVTKVADEHWRTVASVTLRQFSDAASRSPDEAYEAGLVSIWQEPATDIEAHGTSIILNGLRKSARSTLRSSPAWLRVRRGLSAAPTYHVGAVVPDHDHDGDGALSSVASLPWSPGTEPLEAFQRFVEAVDDPQTGSPKKPKLEDRLDYYLQMVWQLSLAAPIAYCDQHPFDDVLSGIDTYRLDGDGPSGISQLFNSDSITHSQGWPTGIGVTPGFRVVFDDLELRRPLRFKDLPVTSNAVKVPMLFAGHLRETFDGRDDARSAGPLEFYAYFLWAPKVVPTDRVGSLVRIHGASGTGFDETFLKYQVAETTRLKQITCEVFVVEGLEGALNIDRESFSFSHAHVERLTSWLHMGLSRAIAEQKRVASRLHREQRAASAVAAGGELEMLVEQFWRDALGNDADSPIPPVSWLENARTEGPGQGSPADVVALSRRAIMGSSRQNSKSRRYEQQVEAIVQMMAAYDLLDDLSEADLENLLRYLVRVLRVGE